MLSMLFMVMFMFMFTCRAYRAYRNASCSLFDAYRKASSLSMFQKRVSGVDAYFINLDRSTERRTAMENQLYQFGFPQPIRVRAYQPKDIIVPNSIREVAGCKKILTPEAQQSFVNGVVARADPATIMTDKVMLAAHCGRPKNTKFELAVTSSHLRALWTAVNDVGSSSYALILEDDVEFAVDVDIGSLIKTAPSDFAMLQLLTSNGDLASQLYSEYTRSKGSKLWTLRGEHDLWCAGAYIVSKQVLRPVVNGLISELERGVRGVRWHGVRVVAAFDKPCFPSMCCTNGSLTLSPELPGCVLAPRGYQADHFIFNLIPGRVYHLNTPIIKSSRASANSTVHQSHVATVHTSGFQRAGELMRDMLMRAGGRALPTFVRRSCMDAVILP